MEILYLDRDIAVILKEPFIPSQPDPSCDADAMTLLKKELSVRGERDEIYLIHRLDRVVGGLLVFARNKSEAARLSSLVASGGMKKEYFAVIDGHTSSMGVFEDYLIKDSATSRAHAVPKERKGAKFARLSYRTLAYARDGERELSLVKVCLDTGRFHQIRIQFSSRKLPLLGDGKYGSKTNKCKVALFASRLTFPTKTGEKSVFSLPNIEKYPWSLFKKEDYLDESYRKTL